MNFIKQFKGDFMLEELIKEVKELQEYKQKYECAQKDKQKMSNLLYNYMLSEYRNITYEENVRLYKDEWCRCCRYKSNCNKVIDGEFSKTIRKPVRSDNGYIPGREGCESFEWR